MTETRCFHGRHAYEQGGCIIVCLDCPARWQAIGPDGLPDLDQDIGLTRSDVRVAPRLLGGSRGNLAADQSREPHPIGFYDDPDPGSKR